MSRRSMVRLWRKYPRAFVIVVVAGSLAVTGGAAAAGVAALSRGGDQPFGNEQVGQNTPH